jgi:hypothetical protein
MHQGITVHFWPGVLLVMHQGIIVHFWPGVHLVMQPGITVHFWPGVHLVMHQGITVHFWPGVHLVMQQGNGLDTAMYFATFCKARNSIFNDTSMYTAIFIRQTMQQY